MDHEGKGCERHRLKLDFGAFDLDPISAAVEISLGFGRDERAQRSRPPIPLRDLVVGACKCLNSSADRRGKAFDVGRAAFALRDQAADQAQNVADAVVQLGDKQVLALRRRIALAVGDVGEPKHDLQQCHTQRVGRAQLGLGPRSGLTAHDLAPGVEAFARRQTHAAGPGIHRLGGIARPLHGLRDLAAEEYQVIARRPGNRDGQDAGRPFRVLSGGWMHLGKLGHRIDLARRALIEKARQRDDFIRRRRLAMQNCFAVNAHGVPVARHDLAHAIRHRGKISGGGTTFDD